MQDIEINVVFQPKKPGSMYGHLMVKQGAEPLHSDVCNIARDKDVTAFVNRLTQRCPSIDPEEVRNVILGTVDRIYQQGSNSDSETIEELDVGRIVRPHLFHVPEVSGLLIPVVEVQGNNQVVGKWVLFMQWSDGKRQCTDLADYIELDSGERLWFHPRPPAPAPNLISRWSPSNRLAWLDGYTPSVEDIFRNLCEKFAYFLEFPKEDAIGITATLALWTILTYAYPAWSAVPYLSVGGPLGSGKSRVFEVLSQLVYNPLHSSNLTAPCLFRTLHSQGGILLLDEAERLNDRTPDAAEIRSILLCGYKRGSQAHRMERVGDDFRPVSFDVYGPKAIAGISGLPAALASRCINIMMFRAAKDSPIPKRSINANEKVWVDLRGELHALALARGASFIGLAHWQPECDGLNGRDLEVWHPILALAKFVEDAGADGLLGIMKEYALKSVQATNDDIVPESDEILLQLLKQQMAERPWGITAGELLEKAKEEHLAIFSRYGARGIGAVLNRYGIKSHRSGGKRYFRPNDSHWRAIKASYGIELGPTEPEDETNGND
jgi:hypothetical protein